MNLHLANERCLVVAHRGARLRAPENTIASISEALKLDIWGVEFDVDLTSDLIPIVIHQESMLPDTTGSRIELVEPLAERAWTLSWQADDILKLDAGSWFDSKFCDVRVPLLEEVLSLDWRDKACLMELKDPKYWGNAPDPIWPEKLVASVRGLVSNFLIKNNNLVVLSFNAKVLQAFADVFPMVTRNLAIWIDSNSKRHEIIAEARDNCCQVISLADCMVEEDPSWCKLIEDAGMIAATYEVSVGKQIYDINFMKNKWKRLIKSGVKAITTDYPAELANFIDQESAT